MRKILYTVLAILVIGLAALGGWWYGEQNRAAPKQTTTQSTTAEKESTKTPENTTPSTEFTSPKGVKIVVTQPLKNSVIKSPLAVAGSVPGSWSFEASFPVKLLDADRNVVAQSPAKLNGDWMTDAMVPFSASIPFSAPSTSTGYLVLEKDNPSGLAENEDKVEIPIRYSD